MAPPANVNDALILDRMSRMKPVAIATLLRIGRRIEEGFEGEVTIAVKQGGVHYIRWVQTETGTSIKEELR